MATSKSRSRSGPVLHSSAANFYSSSTSSAASGFASSTSSFTTRTSSSFANRSTSSFFQQRSTSPTRVHIVGAAPAAPSVRFSLDSRPTSPGRSFAIADNKKPMAAARRRTCMCSPTTHPGSFRCSMHKNQSSNTTRSGPSNQLNMRRSAMTNSLVRIVTVEGDLVKRALSALVRPCGHSQRRRHGFSPRPSRLSVMSKAVES